MKYLKKFEAIIIPSKSLGSGKSNLTFNELVEYGRENGFDVVKWDEFYNSIPKEDRENVPPRHAPFFALREEILLLRYSKLVIIQIYYFNLPYQ